MINYEPIIQGLNIEEPFKVDVLRLDLMHAEINGNKWFKLKYNLLKAKQENQKTIITFGGPHSNHIAATASASKLAGLNSIGIIRADSSCELSPTLNFAKKNGMSLHFVKRQEYAHKTDFFCTDNLFKIFGSHYLIPEGGANKLGVLGCMEILDLNWEYDYIFCASGTATTFSGLLASAKTNQKIIGISVLKGENKLVEDAKTLINSVLKYKKFHFKGNEELQKKIIEHSCLTNNYCFNGYAKYNKVLIDFKTKFENDFNMPLDYIYTPKLFYAFFDLIKNQKFKKNSKILIIHSGGLQGNKAFETLHHLKPNL